MRLYKMIIYSLYSTFMLVSVNKIEVAKTNSSFLILRFFFNLEKFLK